MAVYRKIAHDPIKIVPGFVQTPPFRRLGQVRPRRGFRSLQVAEKVVLTDYAVMLRLVADDGAPLAGFLPG